MSNKTVLVTGGSRGIGKATVELLHEQGAQVLVQYYSTPPDSIWVKSKRIHLLQADLSRIDATENLWQKALEVNHKIDVVINCAGIMQAIETDLPYLEWKSKWDHAFQLNVISLAWLSQQAAQYFAANGGGIVINLSSRAGYMGSPSPNYLNYAASKGAVMSLTKTLARAYAKDNVLAYVIAPGLVETDMTKEFIAKLGAQAIAQSIPLGEVAKPAEVAEIIAFLATGKARQATGSTFHINGGSYI
jgi:NAD(P)-dependent dehydrogenase (short-subunit alcohol dehydrogenase family)